MIVFQYVKCSYKLLKVDHNHWLNGTISNCRPHQAMSRTVLPLAMRSLDEGKGKRLEERCQPPVWVKAREVLRKGDVDQPGCHVLSLMGVRIYSINPDNPY